MYAKLWPGITEFPAFRPAESLENGAPLRKGDALGKLVPQPQELRCIAYLDKTASLEREIARGFLNIKTEPQGKSRRADVRASFDVRPSFSAGHKIKVYLTLPFFPPSLLSSRAFSCSVLTRDMQGVAIPDTAVILRGGKQGVFLVKGNLTEFTEVEGFHADEENFFITKGLVPGNIVVQYADKFKEGIIRW